MSESEEIFDIDGASAFVRLSKAILRRAIKNNGLRAALVPGGGGHRMTKTALVEWVEAGCPGIQKEEGSQDEEIKEETPVVGMPSDGHTCPGCEKVFTAESTDVPCLACGACEMCHQLFPQRHGFTG